MSNMGLLPMRLFSLGVFLAVVAPRATYAQCGTVEAHIATCTHAHGEPSRAAFEAWMRQTLAQAHKTNQTGQTNQTGTIPVVVHIIHDGESVGQGLNIPAAQVQSQLEVLNEDFARLNADSTWTPRLFAPLAAKVGVQFCLAIVDTNGNVLPSPGIDRMDRKERGWPLGPYTISTINSLLKPATIWDPSRYLNIWVCNMDPYIYGYAQYPESPTLPGLGGNQLATTDGVVLGYKYVGRIGTFPAGLDKGRTGTHEVGHFLGLYHTWGDGNCGDDFADDTPTQKNSSSGCPTFPHISCSNGPDGDMFPNYMDYTNDACMNLFTKDQQARIWAVLSSSPRRASLLASTACQSPQTGVAHNLAYGKLTLSPNPAQGNVAIGLPRIVGRGKLWLRDTTGKTILEKDLFCTDPAITLDVSAVAAGTYWLAITTATGAVVGQNMLVLLP